MFQVCSIQDLLLFNVCKLVICSTGVGIALGNLALWLVHPEQYRKPWAHVGLTWNSACNINPKKKK